METIIEERPAQMYAPNGSEVVFMVSTRRKETREYKKKTTRPPKNPHSSEKMEKMKSVLCWGRKR
jgi:hypothetical protein